MIALLSLLAIAMVSVVVTRVATVALIHTGLSRESARFQARSAFTGAGFTTSESEAVVNHPVRRRIVLTLMFWGNVGIAGLVGSVVATFVATGSSTVARLGVLVGGLVVLWLLSRSRLFDRLVSRAVAWALSRWTDLDVRDYADLLHLVGEYRVAELYVEEHDWLAERTLKELRLRDEGVAVLGIQRGGDHRFVGAPMGDSRICAGDTVVVYGRTGSLADLDERRKGYEGELRHGEAVREQRAVEEEERQAEQPDAEPEPS